jgi:integrase
VFSTPRRTEVTASTAGDLWRAAVDGMGLPDRSGWHDLRHFHASLLIADGRSVPAVAERLGHKDQAETLATYSHLWPADADRSAAAVDAALSEL